MSSYPENKMDKLEDDLKKAAEESFEDLISDMKDKEEKVEGKFKFNNQRLMLTYKTHLDKKKLEEFFRKTTPSYKISFWRAAHENADKGHPYPHTHVVVDFGKPFQASGKNAARTFDLDEIHPHIKIIKSIGHFKNAKKYLSKEDPANEDLKKEAATCFEKIQDCQTLQEAMNLAKNPGEAMGIQTMYNLKTPKIIRKEVKLYDWQENLVKELENKFADDRKIIWITDKFGKLGKTTLATWYFINKPGKLLYLQALPGAYHTATIVQNAQAAGWTGEVIMINLSRSMEDRGSIYDPLESLKDGFMTAIKYHGGMLPLTRIPHIVVFANWAPDYNRMTDDRWDERVPTGDLTLTTRGKMIWKDPSQVTVVPKAIPIRHTATSIAEQNRGYVWSFEPQPEGKT